MMWGYGDNSWLWMAPVVVLFCGALFVVIVLAVRAFSGSRRDEDQAMDALLKRFASGAIDQDEFEKTRRILHG
jgi:uncharacterized membrane protein